MRILQLHSDYIEYRPIKREIENAEKCEKKTKRYEDIVVLFTSVEEEDSEKIARKAVEEVKETLEKISAKRVLIYPYAHLSSQLAKPQKALRILKAMEEHAKKLGIETYRSPFGWCKQFSLKIKGHPLAEQLKVITSEKIKEREEEKVSEALKA